jgi:hypothetical protein
MQFSIKNVSLFKEKLQKIGKIIPEVAVNFRKNGIILYGMDPGNIIAITLLIPKKNLAGYKYKPTNSIGLNLVCFKRLISRFKNIKGNLMVRLDGGKIEISAMDGNLKKTFYIPIIFLEDKPKLPRFKPKVEWNVEKVINGFSKIWMFVNKGPLIIDSIKDDFPVRWIIAPRIVD